MALVHMADMLNHAYRHSYAVGAFGVVTLDFLEAIIRAAENFRAPVILNLTESHFDYYDFDLLAPAVVAAARRAKVPVAIHLDHGRSLESAERAIRCGFSGVMVDYSEQIFEDNLRLTRQVIDLAHGSCVTVEAELGYVPGGEGENAENMSHEVEYTSHSEARVFVARSGADCLAVSIGTVHGRMKGVPKLDYARLAKINEAVKIPLVIHGGSGLSDEQFRKLIANGVTKINYYTALSDLAVQHIRDNPGIGDNGYMALKRSIRDAVRAEVERCIRLWGSGGRAAEVLEQCRVMADVQPAPNIRAIG